MKYKNAQEILPDRLLAELQDYITGGVLYVPNRASKKSWGENSGARSYYKQRNDEIREKYRNGRTEEELSEEYGLSADSIHKILLAVTVRTPPKSGGP